MKKSNSQEDFHCFLQGEAHLSSFPSSTILGGGSARVPTLRRKLLPTLEHEADGDDPVMESVHQQAAEDAIEKGRRDDGKLTIDHTCKPS